MGMKINPKKEENFRIWHKQTKPDFWTFGVELEVDTWR